LNFLLIGGGLEEDWRRIGGGLEEDWRRIGGGLEEDWILDNVSGNDTNTFQFFHKDPKN
jgi:hypothetical protein